MSWVVILQLLTIATIFVAILLVLAGEGSREHKLMECFLCGALVQNVGYLLEAVAPGMDAAVTAVKMQFLGSAYIPLCYLWFLYSYCFEKPPKKLLYTLAAADTVMLGFILTCDRHTFFYKEIRWLISGAGQGGSLWLEYGPLYPVFLLAWVALPFALSYYVLIRAIHQRKNRPENRQYRLMLWISLLPLATYILYGLKLFHYFDPTPAALGLTLALVEILVWSRRSYDFRHLAADTVLEAIGDGVIALDGELRLVSCNRAAKDIFPQLRTTRMGEHVSQLGGDMSALLDEGLARTLELDGRFYESHARQITDDNGKCQGYVVLLVDITDTRNYIDEIMRFRKQAEQANMAKSAFLANMSHEIRTPMNAIIGLSDIILEESGGRKVSSYAKDVQAAAKHLLAIINDILDLSKVESGKMELVMGEYRIRNMVSEIVSIMDISASQRGLELRYECDGAIPCAYEGDEGRIKQILINLMNNALKFTKEGYVKLSVSGERGVMPDEELLIFRVEDTGCGIKKEDQEKIFEDFRQVDSKRNRSVEGTGLGLSITRQLVNLMGGSIELESEYEKGSVFTVTIPQRIVDARLLGETPEETEETRRPEASKAFTVPGVKVLIVDDNAVNRRVAKGFLGGYGVEMEEAASGPESIEMVKKRKYDFIFMDHMMPEMDGIEAVAHIRSECGANGADPIIVALTANVMSGVREKFLESGFQDFLAKPMERKALQELMERWIPPELRVAKAEAAYPRQQEPSLAEHIQIAGIDTDVVERYSSGSEDEYRELLSLYCLDGGRKTPLLRELFEQQDLKNYEVEVHGLKSASANIGAMTVSALAKEQEFAAHDGNLEAVEQGFPKLMEAYEELLKNIGAFLDKTKTAPSAEELLPELSAGELKQGVSEALDRVENFRSREGAERVEELLRHRLEESTAAKLRSVQEQLKLFEDDAAEDLLRQLLQELN